MNKAPKKILFIIFQTGNKSNGGVESITQIISHLHIKPTIVTQLHTLINENWKSMGAKVEIIELNYKMGTSFMYEGYIGAIRKIFSIFRTNSSIYQKVKTEKFEVVHVNDPAAFWHTVFGAKLAGAKVIFNIRDTKAKDEGGFYKWKIAYFLSDKILVLSREMAEFWHGKMNIPFLKFSKKKFTYIYSIVNFESFFKVDHQTKKSLRESLQIKDNQLSIGYVATFSEKKAQLNFINHVILFLAKKKLVFTVYFIGDFNPENNEYARKCFNTAKQLGIQHHIKFVGFQSCIAKWYKALDIIALASTKEGMARCMIESISCGTPVVSFDVCSAREILEYYECGFVVKQGEYMALSEAMVELYNNQDVYQKISKSCVKTSRELFDKDKIVEEYLNLCNSL